MDQTLVNQRSVVDMYWPCEWRRVRANRRELDLVARCGVEAVWSWVWGKSGEAGLDKTRSRTKKLKKQQSQQLNLQYMTHQAVSFTYTLGLEQMSEITRTVL